MILICLACRESPSSQTQLRHFARITGELERNASFNVGQIDRENNLKLTQN